MRDAVIGARTRGDLRKLMASLGDVKEWLGFDRIDYTNSYVQVCKRIGRRIFKRAKAIK